MRPVLLVVLLAASTLGVAVARADEIPDAVYVGTHAGGGTVKLHVSPSGTAVDYLEIIDPPGCPFMADEVWGSLPIVDHAFTYEEPPVSLSFQGTFDGADSASGTLQSCGSQAVTWTATAVFPPPPIPPAPPPPPHCVVPKVVGKTLSAAKRKLGSARCRAGRVTRASSPRAKRGRVLSQRPRAGANLPNFGKVNLVIGRGPR
jgi:hypothetical protein